MKSKINTLLDIIQYVENESDDPVSELLMMGFSPCQLVYEFGYDKEKVRASVCYDEDAEDNLEPKEYPFVLGNYSSFDSSLVNHFKLHESEFLMLQNTEIYAKMYEFYKEEKEEALREVENDTFYKYEDEIYKFIERIRCPFSLTEKIKELGFGDFICTSFEEAENNSRRKNVVIFEDSYIYLTFKKNGKIGTILSWTNDELKENDTFETMLQHIKEFFNMSDEEVSDECVLLNI